MDWQEQEVEVRGGRLFCRVAGEGKPLLLIHGLGCDGSFFLRLGEVLAPYRRVVAIDRRGCGRSACEAPRYGSRRAFGELQADDAERVMRALGGSEDCKFDVVGHSAGGIVALFVEECCPALVDRLVAFEPAAFDLLDSNEPVLRDGETALATAQGPGRSAYLDAMVTFMRTMPPADDRAPVMMGDEARCFDRDLRTSMMADFEALFHPRGQLPELLGHAGRIAFATGELSRGYYLAKSTERLAERYGRPVYRCAGSHNAPRDLPQSFAASLLGILALMD